MKCLGIYCYRLAKDFFAASTSELKIPSDRRTAVDLEPTTVSHNPRSLTRVVAVVVGVLLLGYDSQVGPPVIEGIAILVDDLVAGAELISKDQLVDEDFLPRAVRLIDVGVGTVHAATSLERDQKRR